MDPRRGSWLLPRGWEKYLFQPPVPSPQPPFLLAPLRGMHFVELERLLVELWLLSHAFELPRCDIREVLVVAQGLALGRLALFAEVPTARLFALERVERQQFGELEIVGHAAGVFEALVQVVGGAGHRHVVPELVAQLWNGRQRAPEACLGPGH